MNVKRLQISNADANGSLSSTIDVAATLQASAGSTDAFQAWYRDQNGPGGSGSNLSDALTATFCP